MKQIRSAETDKLFKALLTLETVDEFYEFFEDCCTINELKDMSQRFAVAEMLQNGMSYNDVSKQTGASSATISRINRCLNYGEGYVTALSRLKEKTVKNAPKIDLSGVKCLFLDMDDTIFDFAECSKNAIKKAFSQFGLKYTDDVYDVFQKINPEYWKRIESGVITREYLDKNRWNSIFAVLGISFDGEKVEKVFHDNMALAYDLVEGAEEAVEYLSKKYTLFVTSNGHANQQRNRLTKSGLMKYFKGVFVSEEIGVPKPNKAFFDYAIKHSGFIADEIMIVGDSLSADVLGAKTVDIKTCWFDKYDKGNVSDVQPDVEIKSLAELKEIL